MGDSVWGIPRSRHHAQSWESSFQHRPLIKVTENSATSIPCCQQDKTNLGCHFGATHQGMGICNQGASSESYLQGNHMGRHAGSLSRGSISLGSYQKTGKGIREGKERG